MSFLHLDHIVEFFSSAAFLWALLWLGFGIFAVDLLLLMETRWGQTKLVAKCLILSLLLHGLAMGYSSTLVLVQPSIKSTPIHVAIADESGPGLGDRRPENATDAAVPANREKPWETFAHNSAPQLQTMNLARPHTEAVQARRSPEALASALPGPLPLGALPPADTSQPQAGLVASLPAGPPSAVQDRPESIEAPKAQRQSDPQASVVVPVAADRPDAAMPIGPVAKRSTSKNDVPAALFAPLSPLPSAPAATAGTNAAPPDKLVESSTSGHSAAHSTSPPAPGTPVAAATTGNVPGNIAAGSTATRLWNPSADTVATPGAGGLDVTGAGLGGPLEGGLAGLPVSLPRRDGQQGPTPEIYKLRTAPDRDQVAQRYGGTTETQTAVRAALSWLSSTQSPDGRWSGVSQGAGHELKILDHDREGAGAHADTAMTGLALLAYLANGQTHRADNPHREAVRRGLDFLLRAQKPDGSLAGDAKIVEAMYCHAIATFAMSEALGMTGDPLLNEPVQRAAAFSVAAQHPTAGGWRYQPGDVGDTSQMGWQLMALKSAELAGVPLPSSTRQGAMKFLQSVSAGNAAGLASYRPGEPPTHTMTAEALVCWQLLGMKPDFPAAREAADYLAAELPDARNENYYYWYYATLGLHQLQGPAWIRWNQAMRSVLLAKQHKDGPLAGSWDPDPIWGTYGGRIFTTSLGALCLEVYYRYLPLYRAGTGK